MIVMHGNQGTHTIFKIVAVSILTFYLLYNKIIHIPLQSKSGKYKNQLWTSCCILRMEYTYNEYHCIFSPSVLLIRIHAGTDVQELTLRYSGWCNSDSNVFWWLQECRPKTQSVTPVELVNARHAQTVQTPAI